MFSPHLEFAKKIWKSFLKKGDSAVDATCGTGRDTLFLCQTLLEHPDSSVYGFDIQPQAIAKTQALLLKHGFEKRVFLFEESHACFPLFPSPPRLFVYNLGYLPRGDKSITTQVETTMQSVSQALGIVKETSGALSITCYPGHKEGAIEEQRLLDWASSLPSNLWLVCHHRWINRPASPSLLWIEKIPAI